MATTITEAAILEDVISPDEADLSAAAARSLLTLRFDRTVTRRIRGLLQKNNRGAISEPEKRTLDNYLRIGQLLDLLHAKAQLSLRKNGTAD